MKKLLLLFMSCTMFYGVNAQIATPQPSPFSKVEQKVGVTDVTIEYSRPGVKNRTIFGDLVPYGKIWRTGANARTKITFSTDAVIDGQTLKAGSYSIFTIPNADSWDVIFYNDGKESGTPKDLDGKYVAAKTSVKAHEIPFSVESFTIDINNLSATGARLEFIWEKTWVGLDFTVPTDTQVSANIDKAMNGPSLEDYYASATYYLENDKDINKAKVWIDKAIDMTKDKPRFWYLRKQALIHAKAGDTKSAIAAVKASLELAKKAGNDGYVKMNTESLKAWGAM
ncbi:DUF2911 domain-containing protein [uncultured Algibacter sp.]|uniref:DUF2911 domain-containing protein n=1 Tax=uncultured Algibacter sp. TaxID=298659 RepID=UPI00260763DD|nr:DUF2911 domain-containing protein [uncultured Algibacter sp.]